MYNTNIPSFAKQIVWEINFMSWIEHIHSNIVSLNLKPSLWFLILININYDFIYVSYGAWCSALIVLKMSHLKMYYLFLTIRVYVSDELFTNWLNYVEITHAVHRKLLDYTCKKLLTLILYIIENRIFIYQT